MPDPHQQQRIDRMTAHIRSLIPKYPQIEKMTDPRDLFHLPEYEGGVVGMTLEDIGVSLGNVNAGDTVMD